ncbi:MAG: dTDP-4-dehydrorhamnose reductase, partial [Nitrospirae bacterium]
RERDLLRVVDDQVGAPTWARWIAGATAACLAQARGDPAGLLAERGGLYHLACAGETTWYGFARLLLSVAGEGTHARLLPIPTTEYPTPARRPASSRLDCRHLARAFGVQLPAWELGVRLCFEG